MLEIGQERVSIKALILRVFSWLKYLRSKWIIIFISVVIGISISVVYTLVQKKTYEAVLTFALEDKSNSGGMGIGNIASQFGLNLGGGDGGAFAGDNIIELMKSRFLIEKTLLTEVSINGNKTLLVNRYIDAYKLKEKWSKRSVPLIVEFNTSDRKGFSRVQDSVLGVMANNILEKNLSVGKIDKKLSIISVKATSLDEVFSKLFCENLVNNVATFYIETKVGKSRHNVNVLQSRVDSVKNELDKAMYGRAEFSDRNMALIRQSAAVPRAKQELRIQMLGTMYGELVKNLELSKLSLMRDEPLVQIIDLPILPLKVNKTSLVSSLVLGIISAILISSLVLIAIKLIKDLELFN